MKNLFGGVYNGKKVLITGHTGFKGAWLSAWLLELGAEVTGYSIGIPTNPSLFEAVSLEKKLAHRLGDIRDLKSLQTAFQEEKPDVVFHLAAQPITRYAYDIPLETFSTNVMGTVNILECIRHSNTVKAGVIVTSDKCYHNVEWTWGYRENDRLGGDDPYSASKACAEIAFHAYHASFLSKSSPKMVSTVRAGNVIGGGDWAVDRIIPDCMRAFSTGKPVLLRNPNAVRPWQHVLEPLSGYLWIGSQLLLQKKEISGEAFNFGPLSEIQKSVQELICSFIDAWGTGRWETDHDTTQKNIKKEHILLSLNCDKALHYTGWRPTLTFEKTVQLTAAWYKAFYNRTQNMHAYTIDQMKEYISIALEKNTSWVASKN